MQGAVDGSDNDPHFNAVCETTAAIVASADFLRPLKFILDSIDKSSCHNVHFLDLFIKIQQDDRLSEDELSQLDAFEEIISSPDFLSLARDYYGKASVTCGIADASRFASISKPEKIVLRLKELIVRAKVRSKLNFPPQNGDVVNVYNCRQIFIDGTPRTITKSLYFESTEICLVDFGQSGLRLFRVRNSGSPEELLPGHDVLDISDFDPERGVFQVTNKEKGITLLHFSFSFLNGGSIQYFSSIGGCPGLANQVLIFTSHGNLVGYRDLNSLVYQNGAIRYPKRMYNVCSRPILTGKGYVALCYNKSHFSISIRTISDDEKSTFPSDHNYSPLDASFQIQHGILKTDQGSLSYIIYKTTDGQYHLSIEGKKKTIDSCRPIEVANDVVVCADSTLAYSSYSHEDKWQIKNLESGHEYIAFLEKKPLGIQDGHAFQYCTPLMGLFSRTKILSV